jgi:hypothetical protein
MDVLDPTCQFTEFDTSPIPSAAGYVSFRPGLSLGKRWIYDSTQSDTTPRYGCEWTDVTTCMVDKHQQQQQEKKKQSKYFKIYIFACDGRFHIF